MTKQMTIDMDALLERATADCLDSSDLEEFCAALIRRIITLETAARAMLTDADPARFLANDDAYDRWVHHRAVLAALLEEVS